MPKARGFQRKNTRKSAPLSLSVKLPPRRIREAFLLLYELEGCRKAVNYLTEYYGVRRMKIVLNGKRVGKKYAAYYLENCAYFKKIGLKRRIVLHELYHHLIDCNSLELSLRLEEKEANDYAKTFLRYNF